MSGGGGGGEGFPFHDELASLFAERPPNGAMPGMLQQQQPWSFIDYHHHLMQESAPTTPPLDYEAFAGEFDDDVAPLEEGSEEPCGLARCRGWCSRCGGGAVAGSR